MKNIIYGLLLLMSMQAQMSAQTKEEKKIDAAITLFNADKQVEGVAAMQKIVSSDKSKEDNWDILIKMREQHYLSAAQNGAKNARALFIEYVNTCREAELYAYTQQATIRLRNFFVDYVVDTLVSDSAQAVFNKAETFFGKKNYSKSADLYRQAMQIQPDFYKASLYLGDSYWLLEELDSAELYFKKAIERCPDLLEPRKYLVDAYMDGKKTNLALEAIIDAICVYPDRSMMVRLSNLGEALHDKKTDIHWVARGAFPNIMDIPQEKPKDKLWLIYHQAEAEIAPYCNEAGLIVKANTLTKTKYMEVYCWEKMLKSTKKLPKELAFAKKMMDEGWLDCYVFTTMFHFDFYLQFRYFIQSNAGRIRQFLLEKLPE
jgi:tetratricopeptide (TPR) repeat protein